MKNHAIKQFFGLFIAGAFAMIAAAPAAAGVLDSVGGLQVSGAAARPAPAVPSGSPITPLSGRGSAAIDLTSSGAGACPDAPVACNASSGHCECDVFRGTVTLPKIGSGSLTLNITTDDDDAVNNGNGRCYPGTGLGTVCNGGNCFGLEVEGTLCAAVLSETSPSNGVVLFDLNEVFYIVPATSTGKVAGASGGGALEITNALTVVSSSIVGNAGYAAINGALQAHP